MSNFRPKNKKKRPSHKVETVHHSFKFILRSSNLQLRTTYPANIAPVEPVRIPDTAPTECYLLKLSEYINRGYIK